MTDTHEQYVQEIRVLVARQFDSISWTAERPSDWETFTRDFLPGALLSRPAAPKSVEQFVERMQGVAAEAFGSLDESVLGLDVRVFGNVAIAMAVCCISENGAPPERGVEALLLVKDGGGWRIAAQAWDTEAPEQPVPPDLLDRG